MKHHFKNRHSITRKPLWKEGGPKKKQKVHYIETSDSDELKTEIDSLVFT